MAHTLQREKKPIRSVKHTGNIYSINRKIWFLNPKAVRLVNAELLPQRFFLSEGQVAVWPGLVYGDRLALQKTRGNRAY